MTGTRYYKGDWVLHQGIVRKVKRVDEDGIVVLTNRMMVLPEHLELIKRGWRSFLRATLKELARR